VIDEGLHSQSGFISVNQRALLRYRSGASPQTRNDARVACEIFAAILIDSFFQELSAVTLPLGFSFVPNQHREARRGSGKKSDRLPLRFSVRSIRFTDLPKVSKF